MGGYDRLAVARIFFFPALGGLLFGYDIGATSYVLTQLQSAKFSGVSWYDLVARSSALQGLVTSGGVGGAFVGASVVFKVADDLGRRRELLLGAALYVLGAACEFLGGGVGPYESGAGDGLFLLVLGRFVYGVGCGFVMHGAPSYTVWKSNLQPDFNVRVFECFDTSTSAVLRELDESNRFVQKLAESTSI